MKRALEQIDKRKSYDVESYVRYVTFCINKGEWEYVHTHTQFESAKWKTQKVQQDTNKNDYHEGTK